MAKWIAWYGIGVRELDGYRWESGQAHLVEDEMAALNILTQPGEDFRELDGPPPPPEPAEEEAVVKTKRSKAAETAAEA